ncbi:MAG: aldo/keto reductase [Cyanobacteria bacterium P01_F01_bin.13]
MKIPSFQLFAKQFVNRDTSKDGLSSTSMQYRRLGMTDLQLSAVGFGTCQLRMVPEQQALETLHRGFKLGVNFVHTAPDYEGADELVARAIRESSQQVYICTQAYDIHGNTTGSVDHFERLFEEACVRFDRDRIDIFGIACIDNREALSENVWGPKGMVEFLQQKKAEGRIGATFCTTHGSVEYIKKLLKRDVFDALMLAYNPLGFHLLSLSPPKGWTFEDIPQTKSEIFPLAMEKGVGLMIMKPLAGGLLCDSKAFPPRAQIADKSIDICASEILQNILTNPEVTCVVPGTASVEEAQENALAGHQSLTVSPSSAEQINTLINSLQTSICSRCGICDDLCSQKLPVSWLFRASYVNLLPSETFETWDEVEYFHLHPSLQSTCATCPDMTCSCPYGLNIPKTLAGLHQEMVTLQEKGLITSPENSQKIITFDETFKVRVLLKEVPTSLMPAETYLCRLYLENLASRGWFHNAQKFAHASVKLLIFIDGCCVDAIPLRHEVHQGERTHFVFPLQAPANQSQIKLCLTLVAEHLKFSLDAGLVLHDATVKIRR